MAASSADMEQSLLSFEKLDRSSPELWPEQKFGSLTMANLMEKVRGLQNLAYQLGLDESREMTRGKFLNILERPKK